MQPIFAALNFNGWSFLFQVINLLIVFGVLYLLLYKPILKMVADREERIEGSLNNAARAREEAEQLLAQYQSQLQAARQEAQDIVARAGKQAEEAKNQLVGAAQDEAAKMLARAKAEIEGEKAKALAQIREEVATLVILAAGKVIDKTLTSEDQARLSQEFVTQVGELQ